MSANQKIFESKALIRFPDCDPFNHLNNSRYIDYFINAREDHIFKHYQFNLYQLAQEKGISWVVSQSQIAYLKPAFLMETVIITSTLLKLGEKEVQVEMTMWNNEKTSLKALLWIKFTHFNLVSQKSEVHSQELIDRFKPSENPLKVDISFEQRVEELKNKKVQ
jgi:YbgC/YbaW family acyl-CoA thioester hydrolase